MGILSSLYATYHHISVQILGATDFPCKVNAFFSCDRAALSGHSVLFGTIQGFWGLAFFCAMFAITVIGRLLKLGTINFGSLLFGLLGVAYCIRLFWLALFDLHTVCPTCVIVHIFAYLSIATLFLGAPRVRGSAHSIWAWRDSVLTFLALAAVAIAIIASYQPFEQPITLLVDKVRTGLSAELVRQVRLGNGKKVYVRILEKNARIGPDTASRKIIEFIDFTCPACAVAKKSLDRLERELQGDLQIILKHFPQDEECNRHFSDTPHVDACLTARVAQCAVEFGSFERFYRSIFDQILVLPADYVTYLSKIASVSEGRARECLKSKEIRRIIQEDVEDALRIGVTITPGLVARNQLYQGPTSYRILRALLDIPPEFGTSQP